MKLKNIDIKNEKLCMLFLGIMSCLFVLICSIATTPLLPMAQYGDSLIFQTIGKFWTEGALPYVDLWDLKGPLIFFINAVGYFIFGSRIGVCIIEMIAIAVTSIVAYKVFRIKFKPITSTAFSFLALFSYTLTFGKGNTVEAYCLPFIALSFYYIIKWTDKYTETNDATHSPFGAFIYGLCFAASFLTRVTNAVAVCVAVAFIVVNLICHKKWLNLLYNALAFIGGAILLIGPFLIYFAAKGALWDMWYGTIAYNVQYTQASTLSEVLKDTMSVVQFIFAYFNSVLLLIVGALMLIFNNNRRLMGILWTCIATVSIVYFLNTNGYNHYAAIAIPYLYVVAVELKNLYDVFSEKGIVKRLCQCTAVLTIVVSVIAGALGAKAILSEYYSEYILDNKTLLKGDVAYELCKQIPGDERDSFISFNGPEGIYLQIDACPRYRYFIMQDWNSSHDDEMRKEMLAEYENGDAKWVLITTWTELDEIFEILDRRYEVVDEMDIPNSEHKFMLYRLKK